MTRQQADTITGQIDEMKKAISDAYANGWTEGLIFQMHPDAVSRLMIEAAQNSARIGLAKAKRPNSFGGVPIDQDALYSGWRLVGERPL